MRREVSSKGKRGDGIRDDGDLPSGETRKLFRVPGIRVIYRGSHFRRYSRRYEGNRDTYTGRAIKSAINCTLDKSSHI